VKHGRMAKKDGIIWENGYPLEARGQVSRITNMLAYIN
jgi:hypothetical protein